MPSIGNGDKNLAPTNTKRSMSGLTNSGRPGSGKNRFRLGARITLPVVDGYCYVFQNWVFIGVELIHLALPEDSLMMMLCLNTQASQKLPSRTAGGHNHLDGSRHCL